MSFDERKTPSVSEGTEDGEYPTAFSTLTRPVDVPVAKTLQKTARGLQGRNEDGQEDEFSLAQDREQEADCLRTVKVRATSVSEFDPRGAALHVVRH